MRVEGWSWFDNPDLAVLEEYKDVERIVIFDDASYSGAQIRSALEKLIKQGSLSRHFPKAKITLVVPYVTDRALEELMPTQTKIFFHGKMALFPAELKFQCNNPDFKGDFDGTTATYMQHKIAAGGHSTVPFVETGLLKPVVPPYAIS